MTRLTRGILSLLLFITATSGFAQEKKPLELSDILSGKFRGESLWGTQWIPGDDAYSYLKMNAERNRDIWRVDLKTGEEKLLVEAATLKENPEDAPHTINHYEWTSDGKNILFTGTLVARRTKTGGDIFLYNLKEKTFKKVSVSEGENKIAQLSPDGKKLGYVRDNNLYVVTLSNLSEKQLTFDGTDQILNGHFDWVYEEEFSIINGWEWSPDSKEIAYWKLDQTQVPQFQISLYSDLHLDHNNYKYPKAGDPNSIVNIGIVNIETGKDQMVDLGEETDIYIPRIKWTRDSGLLSVQRLNRLQNKLELLKVNAKTGQVSPLYSETSDTWVEVDDDLYFLKNGQGFVWTSEADGYNHIYLFGMDGKLIRQLTKGSWDVGQVHGVDEKNRLMYFSAAKESPLTNDLYKVNLDSGNLSRVSTETGSHRIDFNPAFTYYIDRFGNVETPTKTRLYQANGNLVRTIYENEMKELDNYQLAKKEFLTIPSADGTPLNAWIMKPANMDESKPHPVLMYVYGGPGSQTVTNSWGGNLWYDYLVQNGYIVVSVDNRGTGNRGKAFKSATYKQLGILETDDQIAAARWLAEKPWVDGKRIGIWGWSYGGYMAAFTLFKGHDVFKAAISGAPVTSWRYYDSIYSERFMQTPQLNPEGYDQTAPIEWADKMNGNLLLIHGTADDNVHFQNSIELVRALQLNNKQFDFMAYPDQYHGVGGRYRYHMMNMITEWIFENL